MSDRLSNYRATTRDRVIATLANGLLRLASRSYRELVHDVIDRGLRELVRVESKVQPFTEPMDDEDAA